MYVPLYPRESILTFNIGTLCSPHSFFIGERAKKCSRGPDERPQGFERPCRKAIFTLYIFFISFSGIAGPLRYRKHLREHCMEMLHNLPNHRSDSCAKSDKKFFPLTFFSWFLLLKRCCLVTGLFWGAIDSFAGLFDVFYYILLVKAPVKLTKLTFCAQCVVKCQNPKISN